MPVQVAAVAKEKNRLRQSNKLIISINLTTKSPHKQDDTSIKKHKQQQRPPNEAAANSVRTSRFAKPRLALDVRWQQPTDELGGRTVKVIQPESPCVGRGRLTAAVTARIEIGATSWQGTRRPPSNLVLLSLSCPVDSLRLLCLSDWSLLLVGDGDDDMTWWRYCCCGGLSRPRALNRKCGMRNFFQ